MITHLYGCCTRSLKRVYILLLYRECGTDRINGVATNKLGTFQREFELGRSAGRHGWLHAFHCRHRGTRGERRRNSSIETKRGVLRGFVESAETRSTRSGRWRTCSSRCRRDRRSATVELCPARALSVGFCRIALEFNKGRRGKRPRTHVPHLSAVSAAPL